MVLLMAALASGDQGGSGGLEAWSLWAAWVGAATGVVALLLTWRAAVRESRAQLPVGWSVVPEKRVAAANAKSPDLWVVQLSPMFNDAHGFDMEVYHPGASTMPSGLAWTRHEKVLRADESVEIVLQNGVNPGTAFVRVYWAHTKDITHKEAAWMPLIPSGWPGVGQTPAGDEFLRQISRPAIVRWFRARVLLSPVFPGRGIPGRRAGWRDFRQGRLMLRKRGVKRWDWRADIAKY